jgi:hypothetical protein
MDNFNSFNLDKMDVTLDSGKAIYRLQTSSEHLLMNDLIGSQFKLIFQKEINCTHCQVKINKTYSGGYCSKCSRKLAECDFCILKPETCHYALGTCRDPSWGLKNCMIPHYVYLANSSGLKVGITRTTQIPTRWIDQGAVAALPILKVSSRLQSGIFEKLIGSEINDKTNWRIMLKGNIPEIDLINSRKELFELFGESLDELENQFGKNEISILDDEVVTEITYPVDKYLEKINSISLDNSLVVGGKLLGIKGQYLMFDHGVINIRSHTGYKVKIEY